MNKIKELFNGLIKFTQQVLADSDAVEKIIQMETIEDILLHNGTI